MHGRPHLQSVYSRPSRLRKDFLHSRSLSDIDRSTAANDLRPSASFSAQKNPQCIPVNTPPVFPGLRPRIRPHLLRLVTKAMSDRLLELRWSAHLRQARSLWSIWSIWSIWLVWLVWFNQINKTDQLNETDQTDRTDQTDQTGWRTFLASR